MRGLKLVQQWRAFGVYVASFTDAWIETSVLEYNSNNATNKSHLLQMRGLKPLFKGAFERVFNVASFTGTTICCNSGRFL